MVFAKKMQAIKIMRNYFQNLVDVDFGVFKNDVFLILDLTFDSLFCQVFCFVYYTEKALYWLYNNYIHFV